MFNLLNFSCKDNSKSIDISNVINATSLYNKDIYGRNVKIAIIDTGCSNHSLLQNKIIGGKNFTSEGTSDDYTDFNGHGTHVAGIIGAARNDQFNSIAPNCNLLICKALNKNGEGQLDNIINAIDYAISQNVDIINMSLGCPSNVDELHNIVKKAIDNNICVVCASGNSGDGNEKTTESDYPGAYEEVIQVGAMSNNFSVSNFSNSNKFVDLITPGENILSTYLNNDYMSLSGTSMATPIVSGALALLIEWSTKEFDRKLSEMELYGLLIKNTKNLNARKTLQGHGYLYLDVDR